MQYTLAFLFIGIGIFCKAQQQDSVQTRLNTIKLNLVTSAIFKNSYALSYERVTLPNQSFTVMAGVVYFPTIFDFGSSIQVTDDTKRRGFVAGGEYRFYLRKENKHRAPHGIYIGPFATYYHFKNDRSLSYTSPDSQTPIEASLMMDINVLNIGAQIGYQFVIKNRWTIDMIFLGPSVAHYAMKLKLDGAFDIDEETILESEILTALTDRFPIVKDLLTEQDIKLQGRSSQWAGGFRYQLNVGYHFGRKKKK